MPLSCECEYEPESGVTYYTDPNDFSILETPRRQRCWSCKKLIELKSVVLKFVRFKIPDTDMECLIYGEDGEIPRSSKYLCEPCGDIYFSLTDLKFCVNAEENQQALLKEYQMYYGHQTENT